MVFVASDSTETDLPHRIVPVEKMTEGFIVTKKKVRIVLLALRIGDVNRCKLWTACQLADLQSDSWMLDGYLFWMRVCKV